MARPGGGACSSGPATCATVSVDGRKVYEDGKLSMLEDIDGVSRYPEKLFDNSPLPM
jgi:hypothetical protein